MTTTFPIWMFARGALVLALALFATRLARRAPAALRHTLLASALTAVLALPVLDVIVPTWHAGALADAPRAVDVPPAMPIAEPMATPAGPVPVAAPAHAARAAIPWAAIGGGLWLAGLALGVLRIAVG